VGVGKVVAGGQGARVVFAQHPQPVCQVLLEQGDGADKAEQVGGGELARCQQDVDNAARGESCRGPGRWAVAAIGPGV
jgi:hypothetical protein